MYVGVVPNSRYILVGGNSGVLNNKKETVNQKENLEITREGEKHATRFYYSGS